MSKFNQFLVVCALVMFALLGYRGWHFISAVEQGAVGIQNNIIPTKDKELDLSRLRVEDEANSRMLPHTASIAIASDDAVSDGEDVQIKAGEFAYHQGRPQVRLALYNTGHFTVQSVAVTLALLLNQDKDAVAKEIAIPIVFEQPLLAGANAVVSVPIVSDTWGSEEVRAAQSRRVWAQVVAVSDADRDNVDYPQTGAGVYVKQTANDWSVPEVDLSASAPVRVEVIHYPDKKDILRPSGNAPPPDFTDPTAGIVPEQPIRPQRVEPDPDVLQDEPEPIPLEEEAIPTQTGVISFEYKEFKK